MKITTMKKQAKDILDNCGIEAARKFVIGAHENFYAEIFDGSQRPNGLKIFNLKTNKIAWVK